MVKGEIKSLAHACRQRLDEVFGSYPSGLAMHLRVSAQNYLDSMASY
jgi:hypothetical protein